MSTFSEIISEIKDRRLRAVNKLSNCLRLPFTRFREVFPGFEKKKYIVITANQKVGKSKLTDFLFVYTLLMESMEDPSLKVKVIYFTLEMSPKEKYNEFLCFLLFKLDNIRISPTELRSTNIDYPISEDVIQLIESERYQKYIKAFEEMVDFNDSDRNPTGINKYCRDYALSRGHLNFKEVIRKNKLTGENETIKIVDPITPYTPDDPEEYRIIIIDNASNTSLENGLKKMENIDKLSKYCISLRNQLLYTVILIQHQTQSQEGIENQKLNKLKPSSDGLADCKTTTRDANMVIGLYSPYKYGLRDYEKYDITKFKNKIRFMEIIEDRDYGASGNICPLYFDGATSIFKELPKPENTEALNAVYTYINKIDTKVLQPLFMFTKNKLNTLLNKLNNE